MTLNYLQLNLAILPLNQDGQDQLMPKIIYLMWFFQKTVEMQEPEF